MIRIPSLCYKKIIVEDKVYHLISAAKWVGWWEFLAFDDKDNLYHIEVYYYPEQEEELDEKLTDPEACLLLEKYQSAEVHKLTPNRLLIWNIGNMERCIDEFEETSEFSELEKQPLEEKRDEALSNIRK